MGNNLVFRKCLGCGLHYRMPAAGRRCGPCRERHKRAASKTAEVLKKNATRALTKQARAEGRLIQAHCEKCGSPTSHAHHVDYDDPLNIRWFCQPCHARHHAELRNRAALAAMDAAHEAHAGIAKTEPR